MDEMNKHPEEQEASAHDNDVASEPVANTPVPKAHIPKLPFLIGGIIAFAVIISVVMIALFGGESHHHSFGEWLTTKNPTCTEKGMKVRYCDCGEKLIGSIDATGHNEKVILGKEATCTEDGYTEEKSCLECGEMLSESSVVPMLEHNYVSVVISPTCTKQGYTTYTCKCGSNYVSDYIDKLGHTFGDWKTIKENTTTQEGAQERVCSCGGKESRKLAKLTYSEKLTYSLNADGESYSVTSNGTCKDTYVIIPSTYNGLPVTGINKNAFSKANSFINIFIPDSVIHIDSSTFYTCTSLVCIDVDNNNPEYKYIKYSRKIQ